MRPKDRVIAALEHEEADRVPTGENAVDYELVEAILGHPTLYNARWREMQALWDGRRDEIVATLSGPSGAPLGIFRCIPWYRPTSETTCTILAKVFAPRMCNNTPVTSLPREAWI